MMCCSPDFTNPDADARKRAFDREVEMMRITRRLGGPGATCRVLSGQRYPEVPVEQGMAWVVDAISGCSQLPSELRHRAGHGEPLQRWRWRYPEFAQKKDIFLQIVNADPQRPHFGVQYDPIQRDRGRRRPGCAAARGGARVVSMHASDRYLAEGATLDELTRPMARWAIRPICATASRARG